MSSLLLIGELPPIIFQGAQITEPKGNIFLVHLLKMSFEELWEREIGRKFSLPLPEFFQGAPCSPLLYLQAILNPLRFKDLPCFLPANMAEVLQEGKPAHVIEIVTEELSLPEGEMRFFVVDVENAVSSKEVVANVAYGLVIVVDHFEGFFRYQGASEVEEEEMWEDEDEEKWEDEEDDDDDWENYVEW